MAAALSAREAPSRRRRGYGAGRCRCTSWWRRSSLRTSTCPQSWPVHGTHRLRLRRTCATACSSTPAAARPLHAHLSRLHRGTAATFDAMRAHEQAPDHEASRWQANCTCWPRNSRASPGRDRHTRDFTFNSLRRRSGRGRGAAFPSTAPMSPAARAPAEDRPLRDWAVGVREAAQPGRGRQYFRFHPGSCCWRGRPRARARRTKTRHAHFAMKFQQFTAPVMAKAWRTPPSIITTGWCR